MSLPDTLYQPHLCQPRELMVEVFTKLRKHLCVLGLLIRGWKDRPSPDQSKIPWGLSPQCSEQHDLSQSGCPDLVPSKAHPDYT